MLLIEKTARKPCETDSEYLQRLRESFGLSIFDARKIIKKNNLLQEISRAESLEDIKSVLIKITNEVLPCS